MSKNAATVCGGPTESSWFLSILGADFPEEIFVPSVVVIAKTKSHHAMVRGGNVSEIIKVRMYQ